MRLFSIILNFKDKILEYIFPPRCMFCEEVVAPGKCVCSSCMKATASRPVVRTLFEWGRENIECVSLFQYSGKVREAVCRFKFNGQKQYANYFADAISKNLPNICKDVDFVTAVPLSDLSFRRRGYNQSEYFSKLIAKNFGIEYKNLLVKTKENFPQHELAFSERVENVKGVYKISDIKNVKNKNILLCDDIITTGSTLKECAKLLKLFGARSVKCCTISYVS